MNTKILAIFGLLIFSTFLISASDSSSLIDDVAEKINSNANYSSFVSSLNYEAIKLVLGSEVYYLGQEEGKVKVIDETKPDFTVTFNEQELEEVLGFYEQDDFNSLVKIALKKLPFRVKFKLFFKCLGTTWCRKTIF